MVDPAANNLRRHYINPLLLLPRHYNLTVTDLEARVQVQARNVQLGAGGSSRHGGLAADAGGRHEAVARGGQQRGGQGQQEG